jgi:hypothetical protein
LPELQGHRIVGFTDGLVILINKETTADRVPHPFTRVAVDLPPIAAIFNYMVKEQQSRAWMRAAVCASQDSPDSIAVVAWSSPSLASPAGISCTTTLCLPQPCPSMAVSTAS